MLVIHRKVLFTWIMQESGKKWECLCSALHIPSHSVFSLFSFLLSSVQAFSSSAYLAFVPFCLFSCFITGIFFCSFYYLAVFSIVFHKNWHGKRKGRETPLPQTVFLLRVKCTSEKSVIVPDYLALQENLIVPFYDYFKWRMCHTVMTHRR